MLPIAYSSLLLAYNTFSTSPYSAKLTLMQLNHMHLLYRDFLPFCACTLLGTHYCVMVGLSLYLTQMALSAFSDFWAYYVSYTSVLYQIWISVSVYRVMLPRMLTTTYAMPCNASVSHVHALSLPWGPTCPPLGCTTSISISTSNNGDIHDA